MGKTRRSLYKAARILGDLEAISKGRAGKRIQRRMTGKMAGKALKGSGCFIATACYGSPLAKEVQILSQFRDQYLLTNVFGRMLVRLYYFVSPGIAGFIAKHGVCKEPIRMVLGRAISCLKKRLH